MRKLWRTINDFKHLVMDLFLHGFYPDASRINERRMVVFHGLPAFGFLPFGNASTTTPNIRVDSPAIHSLVGPGKLLPLESHYKNPF
jgi:hypothetical protein